MHGLLAPLSAMLVLEWERIDKFRLEQGWKSEAALMIIIETDEMTQEKRAWVLANDL